MTFFMALRYVLAAVIGLTGLFFLLVSAIGIYRLPDLYTRMHAATKASTLGISGLAIAAALFIDNGDVVVRSILIIMFFFLTVPVGAYALAEAAYETNLDLDSRTQRFDLYEAHILCPVRGGPGSRFVNEKAIKLARDSGGRLTFLHIVTQNLSGVTNPIEAAAIKEHLHTLGQTAVAAAQEQASHYNVMAEGKVVVGELDEQITRVAQEIGATIVLLGYPVHDQPAVQEAAEKRMLALEETLEANLDNVNVIVQRNELTPQE